MSIVFNEHADFNRRELAKISFLVSYNFPQIIQQLTRYAEIDQWHEHEKTSKVTSPKSLLLLHFFIVLLKIFRIDVFLCMQDTYVRARTRP